MMHGGMMHGGMMHGSGLKRAGDLVDEIEFGKAYDHSVVIRLLRYLGDYKRHFATATVAMLIFSATQLAMPWLVGRAVDIIAPGGSQDLSQLTVIFAIFMGNGLFNWWGQWLQLLSMAFISRGILFKLRIQMFDHLQEMSLGFYDRHEVGRVMSRVQNDVASLQEVVSNGIVDIAADFLVLVGTIVIMLTMNVRLTLISLTVMPAMIIFLAIWQTYSRNAFMRVRMAISVVNAGLQENISGARVIQSLTREDVNYRRFDDVNTANLNANVSAGRLSAGILPITEIMMGGSIALMIIFGGVMALDGLLTVGALTAFILYVQRFFDPIRRLTMQYTQLQRAMAGGQRIFEVLDTKPEIVDAADATEMPPITGEIDFDHVSFKYVPDIEVLHDINLRIKPGETVAFVGSTGAGKSTIVSLACRFYEITNGTLTIDGHDIRKVTQSSLRRQIGIVLQEPFLFSGTVRENIKYGRLNASDEEMVTAAKVVGADIFIQKLEQGYDTELQERGSNISIGQRQLLSFARAILADPRILILDEATANVDTHTEIVIQKALQQLLEGRTSLVVAHRLSTVRNADRVVVMENGEIAEIGNHKQLMKKSGLYHHLYTMGYATTGKLDKGRMPNASEPSS